jgi:Flp pilus assembly protein TadG
MRGIKWRRDDERGAAAVEFALVASVLLLIVFGILEFGKLYSRFEALQSAAREGARVAAVRGTPGEVVQRVEEAASPYGLSSTPTVSRTCDDSTAGEPVTVSWRQSFTVSVPFLPAFHRSVRIQGTFRCE